MAYRRRGCVVVDCAQVSTLMLRLSSADGGPLFKAVRSSGPAPRARPVLRLGQPSQRELVCCACINRRIDFAPCEVCNVQGVYSAHPDWAAAILGAAARIQLQAR